MSATLQHRQFFYPLCMTGANFHKQITRPVAGFTLLTFVAIAMPDPGIAQQPVLSKQTPQLLALNAAYPEPAYTLGAGDVIRLDIFNVPEYSGQYQVLVDGTINLPIVGSIPVQGITLKRASDVISSQYARFVRRPIITLSLLAARPLKIGVSGEVNRAGSYTIAPTGQFPTVTQVLQLAGGTTQSANVRQVQVLRPGAGRPIIVNLLNVLQTGSLSQDITLRDGDTVFIPTAANINQAENSAITSSNFGTQTTGPIEIAVVGEVSRPGTYAVKPETGGANGTVRPPSLTQAIQVAGGLSPSANIRQIQVRRPTKNGQTQVIDVNLLQLLQVGDLSQNILLQQGDTIVVPTAIAANAMETDIIRSSTLATQITGPLKIAVVGEVLRPGTYAVKPESTGANGIGDPPTLTQAIQVAGGIKPTADIRQIQVRRSNRSGSEQVIDVNLWQLLQAGDLSQDLLLQEGDTISVPLAANINPAEAEALAQSSFSPTQILVNVVGEVKRPGPVQVPPNTPLNQALLAAGGFNDTRARKSSVDLIRLNPDGTVTKRTVEVDLSQGINDKSNPLLRNNDVVAVNRSGLARTSDFLGTILSPLGGVFSLFNFLRIFR